MMLERQMHAKRRENVQYHTWWWNFISTFDICFSDNAQ